MSKEFGEALDLLPPIKCKVIVSYEASNDVLSMHLITEDKNHAHHNQYR